MRYLLIGFVFIFSACPNPESLPGGASIETSKAEGSPSNQDIPESAKQYIKENFPEWSIADRADYKLWWSFYDPATTPYHAITDLNDDRQVDYACIIKNADSVRLIILLRKGDTFNHWMPDNFRETHDSSNKGIGFGLTIEPPGRIDVVIPGIQSLVLPLNAFNLMEFENRRCIYYWSDGKIAVFQTK